ncbi:hypothetical protein PM082_011984 [Marasmius tenuissimus]|nr:hypothetical protein PM082_011984 [Marasmius tenuissimus]
MEATVELILEVSLGHICKSLPGRWERNLGPFRGGWEKAGKSMTSLKNQPKPVSHDVDLLSAFSELGFGLLGERLRICPNHSVQTHPARSSFQMERGSCKPQREGSLLKQTATAPAFKFLNSNQDLWRLQPVLLLSTMISNPRLSTAWNYRDLRYGSCEALAEQMIRFIIGLRSIPPRFHQRSFDTTMSSSTSSNQNYPNFCVNPRSPTSSFNSTSSRSTV